MYMLCICENFSKEGGGGVGGGHNFAMQAGPPLSLAMREGTNTTRTCENSDMNSY